MDSTVQPEPTALLRPRLILASASPRRLDLLRQIGITPDAVAAAELDETPRPNELPRDCARRLARSKAHFVATQADEPALVIAADTVVSLGRRILPKAENRDEARKCLEMLSGRRHVVMTAVTVMPTASWTRGREVHRLVESAVTFSRLTPQQIDFLLDQGDWEGKAGGYAIQGMAAAFVRMLGGSHSAVMGLPLFETAQMLRGQPGHFVA
ncbi:Maf family protein [Brytella acorum]|uniref:dTTP/UTP pyrophosphatase n=1 Tax=Brytella acorum TaxID=2959299 RepID=A0AA35V8N3_9PROT|nr:Maf family protein [Brytella acorum]MDF3623760.1 Maf family protein [Brytella acorum]CAI9119819.1 Maf family protein [Brytella acorum]